MSNRIALASGIALIAAGTAFATNARVESMGKNATYFMDDVSVWSNPANANLYPNYLLGELGQMRDTGATGNLNGLARFNRDPEKPWFGAIFAKSFSPDAAAGNRYPQVVIGGAFNREDEWLQYFPKTIKVGSQTSNNTYNVGNFPVKFDGLLGAATNSGVLLGVKTYLAYGDSTNGNNGQTSVVSVNTVGANIPLGQGVDLELTGTVSFLDASISGDKTYGGDVDPSFGASARSFISAPQIFGVIVPAASFRSISAPGLSKTEFRIGSGANVSLDRGFFWLGVDYFNHSGDQNITSAGVASTVSNFDTLTTITDNGVRVSFGIERNIWTDWFVIRVGGQKIIANRDYSKGGVSYSDVISNPDRGDDQNDLVSFGFGLNIEDKLKVDAVVAKDILFNGGALFGGPVDHVLSRISASYSF
ncbi:MAG: hypothetical protein AAB214_21705 [Fibrobacterota bacterium]